MSGGSIILEPKQMFQTLNEMEKATQDLLKLIQDISAVLEAVSVLTCILDGLAGSQIDTTVGLVASGPESRAAKSSLAHESCLPGLWPTGLVGRCSSSVRSTPGCRRRFPSGDMRRLACRPCLYPSAPDLSHLAGDITLGVTNFTTGDQFGFQP